MDFTGVALGSGVNQYMKMDEMARQNKELEMRKALADQQLEKGNMELDRLRQADEAGKVRKAMIQAYDKGDWTNPALQTLHNSYNNQFGSHNDGLAAEHAGFDKSGAPVFSYKNADGVVTGTKALTRDDLIKAANNHYFDSIATPELLMQQRQLDQGDTKNEILKDHYSRPTYLQDGTGRIIGIDTQGNQVGAYGSARPQSGGVLGQPIGATDDRTGLVYNTPQGLITRPLPKGVSADNLFPKATGVRGPTNPEDNKNWQAARVQLGPRPAPTTGWFGSVGNQKALDAYDAQSRYIDQVYGVAPQSSGVPTVPVRGQDPIAAANKKAPEVASPAEEQPAEQPVEEPTRGRGLSRQSPHRMALPTYGSPYQSISYDQMNQQR